MDILVDQLVPNVHKIGQLIRDDEDPDHAKCSAKRIEELIRSAYHNKADVMSGLWEILEISRGLLGTFACQLASNTKKSGVVDSSLSFICKLVGDSLDRTLHPQP